MFESFTDESSHLHKPVASKEDGRFTHRAQDGTTHHEESVSAPGLAGGLSHELTAGLSPQPEQAARVMRHYAEDEMAPVPTANSPNFKYEDDVAETEEPGHSAERVKENESDLEDADQAERQDPAHLEQSAKVRAAGPAEEYEEPHAAMDMAAEATRNSARAHQKPFERTVKKNTRYFAKEDKYNRKEVRSNKMHNEHQVGRPGVRVGGERNGHDLFTLNKETAPRFTFLKEGGRDVAQSFDEVHRDQLTLINWKYLGKKKPAGKTRLLLNPAAPRTLEIDGKQSTCVLSWLAGRGSAWIRVSDLKGGSAEHAAIVREATRAAKKWRPARTKADPEHITQYTFRHDDISAADEIDIGPAEANGKHKHGLKIGPNSGGDGNAVSDYLEHTLTKKDKDGHPVEYSYINICLSLPQQDAPPVAADVARPGDMFFVPKGPTFQREIGIYGSHKRASNRRQTWVYGFVGKHEDGEWKADRTRCGWVPLRTLTDPLKSPQKSV